MLNIIRFYPILEACPIIVTDEMMNYISINSKIVAFRFLKEFI